MKKNHTKKEEYCNYSFDDLYKAAYGLSLGKVKKAKLQSLDQDEINKLVLKWAKKAGWKIRKKVVNNKIYLAFNP